MANMEETSNSDSGYRFGRLSSEPGLHSQMFFIENTSLVNNDLIRFVDYFGPRDEKHQRQKLFLSTQNYSPRRSTSDTYGEYCKHIEEILATISQQDLLDYIVSLKLGVVYFFSPRFRFRKKYSLDEIVRLLKGEISIEDQNYYFTPRPGQIIPSFPLRRNFAEVKTVDQTSMFAGLLSEYGFRVSGTKHLFRMYLVSEDQAKHVVVIDPSFNYSITELSTNVKKYFNIDFILDRSQSQHRESHSYDDIFDFRIQFQHSPSLSLEQRNSIPYQMIQNFPSLTTDFTNESILIPVDSNDNSLKQYRIHEGLAPFVEYIRRDYSDIYSYDGSDEIFQNVCIELRTATEFRVDKIAKNCSRSRDTHGLVSARIKLRDLMENDAMDKETLAWKLYDVGKGLAKLAHQCTTHQNRTNVEYYDQEGSSHTANDDFLIQRIIHNNQFLDMLGLDATHGPISDQTIEYSYRNILDHLEQRSFQMIAARRALEKLKNFYQEYSEQFQ